MFRILKVIPFLIIIAFALYRPHIVQAKDFEFPLKTEVSEELTIATDAKKGVDLKIYIFPPNISQDKLQEAQQDLEKKRLWLVGDENDKDIYSKSKSTNIRPFIWDDYTFAIDGSTLADYRSGYIILHLDCKSGANNDGQWCENGTFRRGNHPMRLKYAEDPGDNTKPPRNDYDNWGIFTLQIADNQGSLGQLRFNSRSFSPCAEEILQHPTSDSNFDGYHSFDTPFRDGNESDPKLSDRYAPNDCVYFEVRNYIPNKELLVRVFRGNWSGDINATSSIKETCNGGHKTNSQGDLVTDGWRLSNGTYTGVLFSKGQDCNPATILTSVKFRMDQECESLKNTEKTCAGKSIGLQEGTNNGTGQRVGAPCDPTTNECETGLGRLLATPEGLVQTVLRLGIAIAAFIAVLFIVMGGFQIINSQGNAESVTHGRQKIVSAIAGLIFILLSTALLGLFAGNILGIPQFILGGNASSTYYDTIQQRDRDRQAQDLKDCQNDPQVTNRDACLVNISYRRALNDCQPPGEQPDTACLTRVEQCKVKANTTNDRNQFEKCVSSQ